MPLFRYYDDNDSVDYVSDGGINGIDPMKLISEGPTNRSTVPVDQPTPIRHQFVPLMLPNASSIVQPIIDPSRTSVMMVEDSRHNAANCTYRHDINDDLIRMLSLWLDGPITIVAAVLAFVGCHFAVRFLARAGLNRELTAALYTLCVCDAFLISMVVLYQSIEATSILLAGTNIMWDKQSSVLLTHGIVSSATTASTLLVVFITFQRFLVVWWPLRYARMREPKRMPTLSLHDTFLRKSSSSCAEDTELSGMFRSGGGLVRTLSKRLLRSNKPAMRKLLRPFRFPVCVLVFAFLLNFSVFFEFELIPCYAFAHNAYSLQLFPTTLRQTQTYYMIRTTIAMGSQTIGPILTITLLTIVTEYKVHKSLKARRILFEAQNRRRSLVALEELREKVSRTVAIFIAIKFLIFRSLPIFFDIYETFYGIESFGIILSILVRLSDFGVVLNSATNSLAYFGKTEFFANRLRGKLLREKQHIMVAKVAASACLVTCPPPNISTGRNSSKSSSRSVTIRSMPFSDLARRRQRKTVTYGMASASANDCTATAAAVETSLIRSSFLSLRNGAVSAEVARGRECGGGAEWTRKHEGSGGAEWTRNHEGIMDGGTATATVMMMTEGEGAVLLKNWHKNGNVMMRGSSNRRRRRSGADGMERNNKESVDEEEEEEMMMRPAEEEEEEDE